MYDTLCVIISIGMAELLAIMPSIDSLYITITLIFMFILIASGITLVPILRPHPHPPNTFIDKIINISLFLITSILWHKIIEKMIETHFTRSVFILIYILLTYISLTTILLSYFNGR